MPPAHAAAYIGSKLSLSQLHLRQGSVQGAAAGAAAAAYEPRCSCCCWTFGMTRESSVPGVLQAHLREGCMQGHSRGCRRPYEPWGALEGKLGAVAAVADLPGLRRLGKDGEGKDPRQPWHAAVAPGEGQRAGRRSRGCRRRV